MAVIDHNLNAEHISRPKAGDYWHEFLSPIALVVWTDGWHVEALTRRTHYESIENGAYWRWNAAKLAERMTIEDFGRYVSHADVVPNRQAAVVKEVLELKRRAAP